MMSPKHFSQEVESLLSRAMDAKNSLDSIKAVYALSEKKDKKQVRDALILSLQNPDLDVKMTILEVLCNPHFLDEEILPTMRELIEKEEEEIQVQAVEIIGSIKSEKSADILIEALNDESPRVKYGAMAALANVGHKKASKALENILESREWKDRKHAIDAIGMLANPESKKTMIKGLRDPAPQVREQAALSTGFFQDEEIVDELINLLEDNIPQVVAAAAYTLGTFKEKAAVPYLMDLLLEDFEELNLVAIEALGKIGVPEAVPELIWFLDHPSPDIRSATQDALNAFQLKNIIEPIITSCLEDPKYVYLRDRFSTVDKHDFENTVKKELLLPEWAEKFLEEMFYNLEKENNKKEEK